MGGRQTTPRVDVHPACRFIRFHPASVDLHGSVCLVSVCELIDRRLVWLFRAPHGVFFSLGEFGGGFFLVHTSSSLQAHVELSIS